MLLPGYQLQEQLYESANSVVYRAVRADDEQPVILKMLNEAYPSPERIAWFKREYDVTRNLKLAGVVNVYDLLQQPRFFMVIEDFGGESLKRCAPSLVSGQVELADFLDLAIQVSDILGQVHARHIMHKDINPANIVLNPETGQVKLIDFGISTVLSRETTTFKNPNVLEGTLAYISPEQTGRMNRAMDYRTDFYSLGVTFYELLTGQLPFYYDDPLALVHAHMARQPIPPHEINPKVPIVLSQIVLKLMAKNASDRYHSAHGLKYDLEQLRAPFTSTFKLATHDFSTRFQIPQKLYGRAEEIKTLLASFERVSALRPWGGRKELVLVSGDAGVGKSALVNEIHQPITAKRGYFIRGKFDQLQRGTPYTPFTQAFNEFCNYLLTENQSQLKAWKARILSAVGNNGQILIDVIPNLQQVIGPQPAVSQVAAQQAQNRFNLYFQFFIRALCQPQHPLVIFIDDWQWADSASLNLLELLMNDAENQYLLVIAAYRDNEANDALPSEVDNAHPFRFTLNGLDANTIHTIRVGNLSQTDLTALLEDTFGQNSSTVSNTTASVAALAALIHGKTAGNPFFTHQLLQTLYFDALLWFDMPKRAWDWDMKQISKLALSDNVVDLMTAQLVKLPLATQDLLQLAACIGNRFDLQTLATIYEHSHLATAAELAVALQEGLIVPLSDEYKLVAHQGLDTGLSANIWYRFVHDRVHQAAYSLIPSEQKQTVHLKIARLLLASAASEPVEASEAGTLPSEGIGEPNQVPSDALQAQIFEITNHYNVGMILLETDYEKVALARLNLLAGQKAMSATASQAALDYFEVGLQLLGEEAWSTSYDLALLLHNKAAEAAYLCRHFTQMEAKIEQVLQNACTPLEYIKVYEIKVLAYLSNHNLRAALESGLMALQQLGIQLPTDPTREDVRLALQTTKKYLHGKSIAQLRQLPQVTAPEHIATLQILWALSLSALVAHANLFAVTVFTMVELTVCYGNTKYSSQSYILYGTILCGQLGDVEGGIGFGQLALDLLAKSGNRVVECRVRTAYNYFIAHWKEHVRDTLERMLHNYYEALEAGIIKLSGYISYYCGMNFLIAGEQLGNVSQSMAAYAAQIAQTKQDLILGWLSPFWQATLNLMGKTEHTVQLLGPVYHEDEMLPKMQHVNDKPGLFAYHINKMWLAYLFREDDLAMKHAASAKNHISSGAAFIVAGTLYFYDALIKLNLYRDADEQTQEQYRRDISDSQQKIQIGAKLAPMNYLHKWHLLEAERARVFGPERSAPKHYEEAIKLAHENKYLHEEALAYELAGKFYLSLEVPKVAQLYLRDAHYTYQRWGAMAKVQQLEEEYPFLAQAFAAAPPTTTVTTATGTSTSNRLDIESVLKASQAISGEIHLSKLLDHLMTIVIENAGAEKGCLLLDQNGAYQVAVEAGFAKHATPRSPVGPPPKAIINYVLRSHENVVLNDATHEGLFTQDQYILSHQPKSVLCAPLINQGRLTAILYLENNLTTGAFTPDRLEVLNLLSSQAAISIENAVLYNTLEQQVAERTREAEQARLAAEEANQTKSTFLANMSHELRTPLNAILGFSQLMTRSRSLPSEHVNNLGIISRSGEHLLTLINNVLDLSKIEAGKTTLNQKNFDLYRLLDDLEDMFQLPASDKRLQLIFERTPDLPRYVRTDSVKLRQVLINLLNNAIKFTDSGGVSVHVAPNKALNGATALEFSVSDTGAGIAPEELDKLFEAFVQTQSGKKAQEGTGLGLPISRQFVRLMAGQMSVESQVGRGTTFNFDIQVTLVDVLDLKEARPTRRIIALAPNQPAYRILIVDDKFSNRQLLIQLLNPLGFALKEATNGQEAIEIWHEWSPHLIFLDMRMPVMDGYEATKRIKETSKGQATAIIALTASTFEEERVVVLSAGCDDFLRKPFRESDIFDLMHKHIGVRYIYDEPTSERTTPSEASQEASCDALAALPEALLGSLFEAAEGSDLELMEQVLAQISQLDPTLATQLTTLADEFEYDEILQLIEEANGL